MVSKMVTVKNQYVMSQVKKTVAQFITLSYFAIYSMACDFLSNTI